MIATIVLLLQLTIAPAGAKKHAQEHRNERVTVCGTVARVFYAQRSRGRPTFLDFENGPFTVLIWDRHRSKVGNLAEHRGRRLCSTGLIHLYRGQPQMQISDPGNLTSR
jgi:DNA/RNA endonuclease YhcR with UshA esterase domain